MYQVLDGCLIEVTILGGLLLGWPKGGRSRLMEGGHLSYYIFFLREIPNVIILLYTFLFLERRVDKNKFAC